MRTPEELSREIASGQHSTKQLLRMIAETLPEDQAGVLREAATALGVFAQALSTVCVEDAKELAKDNKAG